MFGDGRVHDPVAQTTAGEWIDASVDEVWPHVTARTCTAAPAVGDVVRLPLSIGPWDVGSVALTVVDVAERRAVVMRTARTPIPVDATFALLLESRWEDRTRLIARIRIALRHPGDFLVAEAFGPTIAYQTRHALRGIRSAAEHARARAASSAG